MAYNRPPNVVLAGRALIQNPLPTDVTPPGIVPVSIDAVIATTANLGVVQVGNGLSITPAGVLSATGGSANFVAVHLTAVNYTALVTDYYIGTTTDNITITLPTGIVGRVYVVKNQHPGNITVTGTGGQTIDDSASKSLGHESSIIVVFDGTRWNTI